MNTLSATLPDQAGVAASPRRRLAAAPTVEVVIPVYNEARVLRASVRKLHDYLTQHCAFTFQITVADNASTDTTLQIAHALSR